MLDTIHAKRDEIYAIARKHKAEKLWVFGSVAREEESPDSDVDMLVKFNGDIGLLEYGRFERELSCLLGRKAELTVNTVLFREPRFAQRVCRGSCHMKISGEGYRAIFGIGPFAAMPTDSSK